MDKNKVLGDVATIYSYLQEKNKQNNTLYEYVKKEQIPEILEEFFKTTPKNKEILLACIDRIVGLKEGAIENVLKKEKFSEEEILKKKEQLYFITRDFYTKAHQNLIDFMQENNLLTPFLREVIKSVHKIGIVFNHFFYVWNQKLILGINKKLASDFNNNLEAILEALKSTLEITKSGEINDRSYSVPQIYEGKYKAVAYAEFFKDEFKEFQKAFNECLKALEKTEEILPSLEQKEAHLNYFRALKNALLEQEVSELLPLWREVDRLWMQLSSPLQIGHPLEYYEDHYRKAVAPEWDIRIARIYEGVDLLAQADRGFKVTKEEILKFYESFTKSLEDTPFKQNIDATTRKSLLLTQSYGGMPLVFYGAEMNGLFSAQVVPNDESVSKVYGKKIFYFPDRVRELSCAKPFMKLSSLTFPKYFLDSTRELLYFREQDWYSIYEIATIGHEFGHILWVDEDSEQIMNKSGQFKNIEEFKATMGGLVYYFMSEHKIYLKDLIFNLISRAVGLVAWMKEGEVLPYYCEGLIHLELLFKSGILEFSGDFNTCALKIHEEKIPNLVELYIKTYEKLARTYLNKQDAKEFLELFARVDKEGYFEPITQEVRNFVESYYCEYEKNGQVLDSIDFKTWSKNFKKEKSGRDNR
ncbi:invasion protein CiaB [Helicobacter burdigaliensis]|uniref:invasion protein CiaB n=1 Tax=Helicobacter burdigaliensis TaxID=2315334 RepID=UPI000EF65552|nr:invasion protein CiaB [Helicobacter burdigaliensis]